MRYHRVLSVFLSVLLLCSVLPVAALAANGTCGTNLNWNYENGVLTLSGSGTTMKTYDSYSSVPWYNTSYRTSIEEIRFETTNLQYISNNAFKNCTGLKRVALPGTVTKLGNYVFQGCAAIEELTFPSSIEELDVSVFKDAKIKRLYIDSIDSIVDLRHTGVYNANNGIDTNPWGHAEAVYVNNVLTEDLVIDADMTEIPALVFAGSPFKTLTIHENVTSIGDHAFYKCAKLETVSFAMDGALETIGVSSFCGCTSLTEVDLPGSVSSVGEYCFEGNTSMAHVIIEEGNLTTLAAYSFANSKALMVFECWPTLTTFENRATQYGRYQDAPKGYVYYNGVRQNANEVATEITQNGDYGDCCVLSVYYNWYYLQSVTINHYLMDTNGDYQLADTETKNRVAAKEIVPASFASAPEGLRYDHFEQTGLVESEGSLLVPENDDAVIDLYYARNQYQIGFKDRDGSVLQEAEAVFHGVTPAFRGTVNGFDEGLYAYTPDGWTPAVSPATRTLTYTATYTRDYTQTVKEDIAAAQDIVSAPAGYDADYVEGLSAALTTLADLKDSEDPDDEAARNAAYTTITAEPVYAGTGETYHITLVLNGGRYNGSTENCVLTVRESDAALTLPVTATRDGYTFDGWRNSADEPVETVDPATLSGDITLTAQWKRSDAAINEALQNARTLIDDESDDFCDDLAEALQPLAEALTTERDRSPRDEAAVESLLSQINAIIANKGDYRHDWGEWVLVEAASEGVDGYEERTCRRHGETQRRTVSYGAEPDRDFRFISMQRMDYFILMPDGGSFAIYNDDPFRWYSTAPLRFTVYTYDTFAYESYVVYINGAEAEPDEDGVYTIPQGSDPICVTIAGAGYLPDTGEKITLWQQIVNLIRSILSFFRGVFSK